MGMRTQPGCLISMHNICIILTVCTKMAAAQASFDDFINIGTKIWNTVSDDQKRMPKYSFKEALKSNLLNSY